MQISVIIPTCDRPAGYLRMAVDSVLAQSFAPAEIIIVDNGSQEVDPTAVPLGVTVYRLPPRVGPSRARNFGAAMARGSHLAFLDDDDWWDADFLQETGAVLKAEGARCVYGRKDLFRNGQIEPYKCPAPETLTIPVLLRRNPGTGGINLLIEKTLFWEVGGLKNDLWTSEDKALAIDILVQGNKITVAPKAAAIVREHLGVRASQNLLGRLRFLFKYRSLARPLDILKLAFRVIKQALKENLRKTRLRT